MTTDYPALAADLRELLEAATDGPWAIATTDGMGFAIHSGEHDTVALYMGRPDAALIVAAVNALPDLLAAYRERDQLRANLDRSGGPFRCCPCCEDSAAGDHIDAGGDIPKHGHSTPCPTCHGDVSAVLVASAEAAEAKLAALRAGVEAECNRADLSPSIWSAVDSLQTPRPAVPGVRGERGMKLYIAGPMTGLPEFNYPAFFIAAELLQRAWYETLNPARHEPDPAKTWADYMRLGLTDVCAADGIAVLDGWINSKGARWEVQTAQRLGIPIKTVAQWIEAAEDA